MKKEVLGKEGMGLRKNVSIYTLRSCRSQVECYKTFNTTVLQLKLFCGQW